VRQPNYYPFGLKHKGYNNVTSSNGNSTAQKFKYNGVELNESLGLNLYEMDVRMYDPAIGRFNGLDPVTHHSQGTSVAFDNNPVYWADPSGADSVGADGLTNEQWMDCSSPGGDCSAARIENTSKGAGEESKDSKTKVATVGAYTHTSLSFTPDKDAAGNDAKVGVQTLKTVISVQNVYLISKDGKLSLQYEIQEAVSTTQISSDYSETISTFTMTSQTGSTLLKALNSKKHSVSTLVPEGEISALHEGALNLLKADFKKNNTAFAVSYKEGKADLNAWVGFAAGAGITAWNVELAKLGLKLPSYTGVSAAAGFLLTGQSISKTPAGRMILNINYQRYYGTMSGKAKVMQAKMKVANQKRIKN